MESRINFPMRWVSTRSVSDEKPEVEPKLSYDNRSRDFPDILEEDEEGDVTFGR